MVIKSMSNTKHTSKAHLLRGGLAGRGGGCGGGKGRGHEPARLELQVGQEGLWWVR